MAETEAIDVPVNVVVTVSAGGAGEQGAQGTPPVLAALQYIGEKQTEACAILQGIATKLDSIATQAGQSSQGTAGLLVEIRDRLPAPQG